MKKILILSFLTLLIANAFAGIHEKYTQGYRMLPSVVNTKNSETAMSFFKEKIVYSVIDSTGNVKLYSAAINKPFIELEDLQEENEMTDLKIHGTFGFDEKTNKIYFSRYDKSTKNYMLYESTLTGENSWSKPKKLKIEGLSGYVHTGSATVNAGWLYREPGFSGFFNPTLAKDGSRIYFSASFSGGKGERDIWYVDAKDKNKWTMPQNIGEGVNTSGKEDYPFVLGDSVLYFATTTDSYGGMDLSISRFKDGKWDKAEALDHIYNSSEDDYNLIGTPDVLYFISGRNTGHGDDIYRPARMEVGEMTWRLAEAKPEAEPYVALKSFPWKLFYFDFDKDLLSQEFIDEMDELFVAMQDYIQDHNFVIHGHTDSRGSVAYNEKLSLKRAQRIYTMLIERGIPAEKMSVVAHGFRNMVIPNAQTEEEHAQNRRVEVDIVRANEADNANSDNEDSGSENTNNE